MTAAKAGAVQTVNAINTIALSLSYMLYDCSYYHWLSNPYIIGQKVSTWIESMDDIRTERRGLTQSKLHQKLDNLIF